MAVEQTQVLPAPVLEGALTAFTKKLTPLIGQKIDTTKFDPQVAAQTQAYFSVHMLSTLH